MDSDGFGFFITGNSAIPPPDRNHVGFPSREVGALEFFPKNPNQKADSNTMENQAILICLHRMNFGPLRIWMCLFNTIPMQISFDHIPP